MRNKLVGLLLLLGGLLGTSPAQAEWRNIGRGYYLSYNGGRHDGWYYKRAYNNYSCNYYYTRYSQVPANHTTINKTVNYTANWKSDLVKALDKAKDNELFLQALRESGLAVQPVQGGGVAPSAYGQAAYLRGLNVYQQGVYQPYAQQGATLYGLAAYAPNIGQVDIAGLLQQQVRIVDRLAVGTQIANNALGARVEQVSAAQADIARIQAAGQVLIETMRVAAPPRTVVQQWETGQGGQTGGNGGWNGGGGQGGAYPPDDGRPSVDDSLPPTTGQSQGPGALDLVRATALFNNSCVKCHGGEKVSGGLDLTGFASWDAEDRADWIPHILERVTSQDPTQVMPPPASGLAGPTAATLRSLYAFREER